MSAWWSWLGAPDGARISPCEQYRTLLWRTLPEITFGPAPSNAPPLVFCMLNPSTADAVKPDPTITRCLGFAKREGAGGIVVVNLSPWRSAYPSDLEAARRAGHDVALEAHNRVALELARLFGPIILAWGAGIRPWMDRMAMVARKVARKDGSDALCLGKTKQGEPRHPLMVRADAPLVRFP